MQSFRTLRQPLLGEKYVTRKERKKRKERKIIPKIVDTTFRFNAQGQRTHFARTNNNKTTFLSYLNYARSAKV